MSEQHLSEGEAVDIVSFLLRAGMSLAKLREHLACSECRHKLLDMLERRTKT